MNGKGKRKEKGTNNAEKETKKKTSGKGEEEKKVNSLWRAGINNF